MLQRVPARARHWWVAIGLLALMACTPPTVPGAASGAAGDTRSSWADWEPAALGEIRLFGGNSRPRGWVDANGRSLQTASASDLAAVLGVWTGYGKTPTFTLPDLPPVRIGEVEQHYVIAYEGRQPDYTGKGEGLEPGLVGEVRLWPLDKVPSGWLPCDGAELPIHPYEALHAVIETTYGGNGSSTFKVPQLPNVGSARYLINFAGKFPGRNEGDGQPVTKPTYGQIGLFAGTWIPKGWAECDGREVKVQANLPLFSLFGTTFGGDGRTTFALPKMTFEAHPSVRYATAIQGVFPYR